jgi:hypothetical protein
MVNNMAVVVSELLCFLRNKFGKTPDDNVKTIIFDFYDDDDIIGAKKLLHDELSKLKLDNFPDRLMQRKGDNKKKFNLDDVFVMFAFLIALQQ